MSKPIRQVATCLLVAGFIGTAAAQQPAPPPSAKATMDLFEHYETVRSALSADSFPDIAKPGAALAAAVEPVGGAEAQKAATALASAQTLEAARTHFGELSAILVPIFQAAAIPGATAYVCPMKKQPWMQKGDQMRNPYYGKAMPTCGSALPVKK